VFLAEIIQRTMKADIDAVIGTFGKNEQIKKVFTDHEGEGAV
jgi:hypothetical protein